MNYLLSQNKDNLLDFKSFQHCFIQKNETVSIETELYPLLFILKGQLVLHFNTTTTTLSEGYLSMVNSSCLTHISTPEQCTFMAFFPQNKLTSYIKKCSSIFKTLNSLPIYFNAEMKKWITEVSKEINNNPVLSPETNALYCQKLVGILMQYTQGELGELYVPFIACSKGYCNTSKTPHCCNAPE